MPNKRRSSARASRGFAKVDLAGQRDLGDGDRTVRRKPQKAAATISKTGTLNLHVVVRRWHGRQRIELREVGTLVAGTCFDTPASIAFGPTVIDGLVNALIRAKEVAQ